MLTAAELVASLRVLRALRTPRCASVALTWPDEDARAYVRLARSGYAGTWSRARRGGWDNRGHRRGPAVARPNRAWRRGYTPV